MFYVDGISAKINKASQQFIRVPLLHAFNNCNVSANVPHSCLFCKIRKV